MISDFLDRLFELEKLKLLLKFFISLGKNEYTIFLSGFTKTIKPNISVKKPGISNKIPANLPNIQSIGDLISFSTSNLKEKISQKPNKQVKMTNKSALKKPNKSPNKIKNIISRKGRANKNLIPIF